MAWELAPGAPPRLARLPASRFLAAVQLARRCGPTSCNAGLRSNQVMSAGGDEPVVLSEVRGAVGVLTLNRPTRLNAWTGEMQALLYGHLENFEVCMTTRRAKM